MIEEKDLIGLIEGCGRGDRKSQQRVYEVYYGKMLSVCLRYSHDLEQAKDVLQDGFIKVFSKIEKYDHKGSFEGWMRRIIVNTAIDHFRKKKTDFVLLGADQSVEDFMEVEEDEDEGNEFEFKASQVIEAMQMLSPAYRTIFNLYVFESLSHKEIAARLNISVGTSKSNYAKAKRNLKKILLKEFKQADG